MISENISFFTQFPIQNVGKFFVSMENVLERPFSAISGPLIWPHIWPSDAYNFKGFALSLPTFRGKRKEKVAKKKRK